MKHKIFPIYYYTNSKSFADTINFTKTLTEKMLKVFVCVIREMIDKQEVESTSVESTTI